MFTSDRERRLWALAAIVVAAIYSTLGVARVLADELRNRELVDSVFVVAFMGIIVAGIALGLRTKASVGEVVVVLAALVTLVMLSLRMAVPEERTHLMEYATVTIIVYEALRERSSHRSVRFPALTAFFIASAIGIVDELIQLAIPSRVFDPVDILFNVLAALVSVMGVAALAAVRRSAVR